MQDERLKAFRIAVFTKRNYFMLEIWHCVEMCSYLCTTNLWKFNSSSENGGSFKQLPKYGGPTKRIIWVTTDLGRLNIYLICNTHYVNHIVRGLPKPVFTVKCCDLSLVIGQDNDLYCNLSTYFHGTWIVLNFVIWQLHIIFWKGNSSNVIRNWIFYQWCCKTF